MRIWITWVLVGWFALLPTTVLAEAQDWAAVQQLPPGSRLRIRVPGELLEDVRFREATEQRLTVSGRPMRIIQRDSVEQIDQIKGQRAKGALLGIAAGFGIGLIQSYAGAESHKLGFGLYLGLYGGALGGALGALLTDQRIETVYRK